MIHLVDQWLHGIRNTLMIVNPTDLGIHLPFDMNLNLKAMPVHLSAFVIGREAGQSVGRFKAEVLNDSSAHS